MTKISRFLYVISCIALAAFVATVIFLVVNRPNHPVPAAGFVIAERNHAGFIYISQADWLMQYGTLFAAAALAVLHALFRKREK
jgi:hypothetical protein